MGTRLLLSLFLSAVIFNAVIALPLNAVPHVVHEKRTILHQRWTQGRRVNSGSILPMRIGLVQSNIDSAHEQLMDVAHPASPNYGKHWTAEQVVEHFQPSSETVSAVRDWLVKSGVSERRITVSDNKAWLAFDATASEVEGLLHTKYFEHEDSVTGGVMPACESYHVPAHVQRHIDYITPGIKLLAPPAAARIQSKRHDRRWGPPKKPTTFKHYRPSDWKPKYNDSDLDTCDVAITPACVAALYNIPEPNRNRRPNPKNSMGIYESEAEYYSGVDLDLFFRNFTPWIPQGTRPLYDSIDGAPGPTTNVSEAGGEVELDLELSYPIVYPQTITIFQEDDAIYEMNPNITYTFGFNTFLDAIDGSYCNYTAYGETGDDPYVDPIYPDPAVGGYKGQRQCGVYEPTTVISFSYGGQEVDVPWAYQKRQCNEWLKLGLQGVSILFASGDSGVSNYPEPYGIDGPTGCIGPKENIFNPTWPNNCPWLTNVGATKVYPGKTVFEPESAVYDPAGHPYHVNYSSGGGFSNIYATPDYQQAAVATYFKEHNPPYPSYSGLVETNVSSLWDAVSGLAANGGIYNRIGRGIPDVAANGDNIAVSTHHSPSF